MPGKVMETVVKLMGSIDPSLAKSISTAQSSFKKMGKTVAVAGKALAGIATVGATAAGAITGYLVKSGTEYIKTMNDVAAQTGMTGEELKAFGDTTREIWKNGGGENLQEVADALTNIKQASGLAGDELKTAAESALLLKDSFGFEVEETTRAATSLMKNFGISAEEAYGLIATGSQNGANKNGDLLDTLNEYSVHYKALGLDADQFVTSLISGAEAGSFSIDKIGDAVKEFTIRSKDGSDTTADAFKQLGLNSENMTKAFASGGDVASEAFFQTVEAINAIEDPVKKNATGVALFGSMFEDLEAGVLDTLGSMKNGSLEATAALEQMEQVKYNDLGSTLEQIGRSIQDSVIPYAEKIAQIINDNMPQIQASIEKIIPIIAGIAEKFVELIPRVIEFVTQLLDNLGPAITFIIDNMDTLLPILAGVAAGFAAYSIISSISALMGVLNISTIATTIANGGLLTSLQAVWAAMMTNPIGWIAIAIGALIAIIVGLVTHWDEIKAAIGRFVEGAKTALAPFIEWISERFNAIKEAISKFLEPLKKVKDVVGKIFGGGSSETSEIPAYASGGFTDGVSIAGEAGTEAVISFDPAYRNKNIDIWQKAGELLGVAPSNSISNNIHGLTINFKIENKTSEGDIVSEIKNSLPDIVDEFMEEINRRATGSYKSFAY